MPPLLHTDNNAIRVNASAVFHKFEIHLHRRFDLGVTPDIFSGAWEEGSTKSLTLTFSPAMASQGQKDAKETVENMGY